MCVRMCAHVYVYVCVCVLGARSMGSVVYSVHVGRDWVRKSESVRVREKGSAREREREREREAEKERA